jgi:hypothetical protein
MRKEDRVVPRYRLAAVEPHDAPTVPESDLVLELLIGRCRVPPLVLRSDLVRVQQLEPEPERSSGHVTVQASSSNPRTTSMTPSPRGWPSEMCNKEKVAPKPGEPATGRC